MDIRENTVRFTIDAAAAAARAGRRRRRRAHVREPEVLYVEQRQPVRRRRALDRRARAVLALEHGWGPGLFFLFWLALVF
jgi:hypothetical protein